MRIIKKIIPILLIPCLTGCVKSISFTAYWFPDSIAIEYKDEEYKVTTLITNPLANVNFETSSTTFPNLLLLSKKGKTISEAFQKLRVGEQGNLSPVYLKSLVLHESIFKESSTTYEDIIKMLIQNPNHNLKIWIYITDTEIEEIYSVKNFMNSSPYFSNLNFPSDNTLNIMCNPINLITSANELLAGRTTYLPMLSVDENSIKQESIENGELENKKTYYFKEMCFITINSNFKCIEKEYLEGYKWIQAINDIDDNVDEMSFGVKKTKIKKNYKNEKLLLNINLSIMVYDNINKLSEKQITDKIEQKVKKEVSQLAKIGYEHKIDVFNLQDHYKRYNNKAVELTEESVICEVTVNLMTQSIFD